MNVLLAIDDSGCSEAAIAAVQRQFTPGITTVRVVHVVEWPQDLPPALAFAEGPSAADSVLAAHQQIRGSAERLVARAAGQLREFKAAGTVVEGDATTEIVRMAAEWPADLIVLGSHGRSAMDRLLLGSVSKAVLRHAGCPVHVVEPSLDTDQPLPAVS